MAIQTRFRKLGDTSAKIAQIICELGKSHSMPLHKQVTKNSLDRGFGDWASVDVKLRGLYNRAKIEHKWPWVPFEQAELGKFVIITFSILNVIAEQTE